MAQLNGIFDATQVEPAQSFDPIPDGWYVAKIIESDRVPTKAGTGSMLKLQLIVLDGEHKNRRLFDRLNIDNPNTQAVEIAYRQLSAICAAIHITQLSDSMELHGIPLMVKVGTRPPTTGPDGTTYDAQNVIKGYKELPSNHQLPTAPVTPMGQEKMSPVQATAAAGNTPAWAQNPNGGSVPPWVTQPK